MSDEARPVLALDIGGTKLAVAVVTADGAVHGAIVEPTRREEGPDAVVRRLLDMARRTRAAALDAGLPEVGAAGISCGGPLDAPSGVLLNPLHLPGWDHVPIVRLVEKALDVPAVLENDATAAALGEYRYGAGTGTSTMVYLTISTGIGGGAVINGELHRGAAGNGGEFGHVTVQRGGRRCLCGRNGCLEAYASGTSIADRAREALADGRPSSLSGLEAIRAEDVSRAAAEGDPVAAEVWAETVELLAVAVTDLVNVLEPDLVVLGGGVTRSGSALLDPVRRIVLHDAMPPAADAVRIELAALGDMVGVVGAAAVAFDRTARTPPEASPHG